ncbi:hypothetical protein ACLOJK_036279 [Asimina triloba]
MVEIRLMLDEIERKMRQAGYKSSASEGWEEEEGIPIMNHHSEKLAIAFGLIKTCHTTPIRVMKNLRDGICSCMDCWCILRDLDQVFSSASGRVQTEEPRFHFNPC